MNTFEATAFVKDYQSATRIVTEKNLSWPPTDVGRLASLGLVRYEQRGYYRIYYVPDVLTLYRIREQLKLVPESIQN